MKKGSVVLVCDYCKKVFNLNNSTLAIRPVNGLKGVEDIGIECPNCEAFIHSYYQNEELKALQNPDADRKHRRAYKKKFVKFNRWVKRKLQTGRDTS